MDLSKFNSLRCIRYLNIGSTESIYIPIEFRRFQIKIRLPMWLSMDIHLFPLLNEGVNSFHLLDSFFILFIWMWLIVAWWGQIQLLATSFSMMNSYYKLVGTICSIVISHRFLWQPNQSLSWDKQWSNNPQLIWRRWWGRIRCIQGGCCLVSLC